MQLNNPPNSSLAQETAIEPDRPIVEEELRQVNRALKTLRECNKALVRARQESDLLHDICRIIVEVGGYRLAWVGFAIADEQKRGIPVAQAGYEDNSYAASIALPLMLDGQSLGVLNIYATKPDAFDTEEVKLLAELADVLAYGIGALRTRDAHEQNENRYNEQLQHDITERERAEAALLESQTRLSLINSISTGSSLGISVAQVIERGVKQISEYFNTLRVAYSTVNEQGILSVLYSIEPPGMPPLTGNSADLTAAPEYLNALRVSELVIVEDVATDSRLAPLADAIKAGGIRAVLDVPLQHSEQLVGLLCFDSPYPRKWSEHEIVTSREVADYLFVAIMEANAQQERQRAESELREMSVALQKALEREKEIHELKSRFVTMISHEFRTPLTTILGSTELLKHYSHTWTDEKKLLYFNRIQATVQHLNRMLDEVLLLGKAEAGKLEFKPDTLNLVQFCRSLVEELQLIAGPEQTLVFSERVKCTDVYMDEKLLRQILGNLLSNAIKYSPAGSTVRFDLACEDETVVFQIQDQGIGIPTEDQQHLFESFYRATNVGKVPGTGLGLEIVKKAVDLHSGKITVKSEVGMGTTFTVTIPLDH